MAEIPEHIAATEIKYWIMGIKCNCLSDQPNSFWKSCTGETRLRWFMSIFDSDLIQDTAKPSTNRE